MRIIITGTPGTGKSAVAARLSALLASELIDIASIARERKLVSRKHEVDVPRLAKALSFLKGRRDYVAEGHLACEMMLPADHIFVLRCDPDTLSERLNARGYAKTKIDENVMAEVLDYCTQRVLAVYRKTPLELDTSSRTPEECARIISFAIKNKKKTLDKVDYSGHLLPRS